MTAWRFAPSGKRGVELVMDLVAGRVIGEVRHNVVADGAIKWSAYDAGGALDGSYLFHEEAAQAVVDHFWQRKEKPCGSSPS